MATVQEGIFTALKNDAAISTKVKVGTFYNIHTLEIPTDKLQTCSYHIIYGKRRNEPISYIDLERAHFDIYAAADTYAKAQDLREDIIRVLERFKGNLGSSRDVKSCNMVDEAEFKTQDTKMYYVVMTFKLKYFGDNV